MSQNDYEVMQEAVDMLRQLQDFDQFAEMSDMVSRLQNKLAVSKSNRKPIVHFDSVPQLKGLRLLNPLYNYIAHKQTLRIMYQSFVASQPAEFIICPYLLKEFRNRWFLFGSKASDLVLYNLSLDRIVSIEPCDEPFRENPDFDSEHFFDNVIGVSKNFKSIPRNVMFWADERQSQYIMTKPLHPSQQLKSRNPDDGSCVFQIDVVLNREMYSVFMSYGPGVRIIYPRNAVAYMRDKLHEMVALYDEHAE